MQRSAPQGKNAEKSKQPYDICRDRYQRSGICTHYAQPGGRNGKGCETPFNHGFVPMYDADIIAEYEEVLHREKFPILPDAASALISYIIENGVEASRADFAESMPDEDDRVFYEVSLSNEDSFLVTGNLKHYPISPRVITPAAFIDIVSDK